MNVISSPSPSSSLDLPHGLRIDLVDDIAVLETEWKTLFEEGTGFIFQHYDWVSAAYETYDAKNRPVILTGRSSGRLQFIIPMVLVSGIPAKLRWPGDSHTNIGCGLFSKEFLGNYTTGLITTIFEKLQKHMTGIVVLHLKNQPKILAGHPNPLLELPHQSSANPFYIMDLEDGLDSILDRGNGKRKRKQFRRQQRVAEELGGYELVIPKDPKEIEEIMTEFFTLKSARFAELGINDVFEDSATQQFLLRLAMKPEVNGNQLLRLFVLKVGGKMRAMYGGGILTDYCQSCINAVAYDDFAEESPGEMVMYLMVDHLIKTGFKKLDLGVGQERYKVSWCRNTQTIMDTVYPLSYAAIPFSQYLKSETRLKEVIKSNQMLWENFKKFRKLKSNI
ncbi:MAG: GNAT family N-acetyltransferase [Pseudomonadota bacterium]